MAPKVDQAGSVVDDGARHWIVGPLTCRSTESRDWLRSAAARAGEISSSARKQACGRDQLFVGGAQDKAFETTEYI